MDTRECSSDVSTLVVPIGPNYQVLPRVRLVYHPLLERSSFNSPFLSPCSPNNPHRSSEKENEHTDLRGLEYSVPCDCDL